MLALAVGCGSGGGGGGGSGEGAPTLGRLPGLSGPMGIATVPVAIGGKARVLVLEEQTGELSRADPETGEIELIAKGLSSPFAMVMEPEAGSATALVTEANRLSRVNLTAGTVTPLASFANRPTGLAIDPDQPQTVWVVEEGTGDLYRVRRSDGSKQRVPHQPGLARARGLVFETPGVLLVAEGDTANGGIVRVDLRPTPPTAATIIAGQAELRLPFGLDLGVGGNFAYVTAQAANQLARLDGLVSGTAALQTHIDALKGPTGLARLPDGRLVVAQHSTNDLVVLDPDCATIPCQAPPPVVAGLGTPGDLVLEGPDTALVLERNGLDTVPDAGALSRINTKTGKVTEIASGLATPEALVLADRTAYVAEAGAIPNTLSGTIRQIPLDVDAGAPTVLPTAPLDFPSGMALADPSTLVIVERTGSLVRVTLPGGAVTRLPLTPSPAGIAVSQAADGVHAYVTDASAGTLLRVRNVVTCNPCSPEPIAMNLPNPSGVAVEPSGASALVVTDTGNPSGGAIVRIVLQDAAMPTPSTIVKGLTNPRRIAIEPGGATALITENNPDGVRRVALPAP